MENVPEAAVSYLSSHSNTTWFKRGAGSEVCMYGEVIKAPLPTCGQIALAAASLTLMCELCLRRWAAVASVCLLLETCFNYQCDYVCLWRI